jgi:hypothetical protein
MDTKMADQTNRDTQTRRTRSRSYLTYLIIFMGLVAIMDQYLSTIKTTAIPYIIEEYGISASRFSWLEALYLFAQWAQRHHRAQAC